MTDPDMKHRAADLAEAESNDGVDEGGWPKNLKVGFAIQDENGTILIAPDDCDGCHGCDLYDDDF